VYLATDFHLFIIKKVLFSNLKTDFEFHVGLCKKQIWYSEDLNWQTHEDAEGRSSLMKDSIPIAMRKKQVLS
jgi:hypothetical protein